MALQSKISSLPFFNRLMPVRRFCLTWPLANSLRHRKCFEAPFFYFLFSFFWNNVSFELARPLQIVDSSETASIFVLLTSPTRINSKANNGPASNLLKRIGIRSRYEIKSVPYLREFQKIGVGLWLESFNCISG